MFAEYLRGSAAADLQQTSIHTCASKAAGDKQPLIFNRQSAHKQGEQRTAKQRGEFGGEGKGVHVES